MLASGPGLAGEDVAPAVGIDHLQPADAHGLT